jgi:hypothetical protein
VSTSLLSKALNGERTLTPDRSRRLVEYLSARIADQVAA